MTAPADLPAVELDGVDKIHPLRTAGGRSLKHQIVSLFRGKSEQQTVTALKDFSLRIEQGKSLGVIGANGAGKSSLLRLIAGISEPSAGRVRTRGLILPMLELGAGFHPDLSGYENIFLQGILLGIDRNRMEGMVDSIIDFAEIREFIHMPVRHYSSGMYLRLGFAISAHIEPDILLIDEAFSVGDLYFQEKSFERIREMHRKGCTLILVTHDIDVVERLCDEVIWLDKGRLVDSGSPIQVALNYKRHMFNTSFPRPLPTVFGKQVHVGAGRYGSGEVTFSYLEFRNAAGQPTNTFQQGDAMTIHLRYAVHAPVDEADCLIAIQSDRGHGAACIATSDMRRRIQLNPRGGEIVFPIDRLDLAPGRFELSAVLHRAGATDSESFFDFHLRVYSFHVSSPPGASRIAGVDPPASWNHEVTQAWTQPEKGMNPTP